MLEIALLVLVFVMLGLGSAIGIYVAGRAYFGGRSSLRPLPRRDRTR
ncbi:MAG TPA: hypothetical protein VNE62_05700 [Actinomycetota bacterium]|nr:hypothetical protein [Actinomycetota bacterium]